MTEEEEFAQYQLQASFYPKPVAKRERADLYEAEVAFYGVHYVVGTARTREQALAMAQTKCDDLVARMLSYAREYLKPYKVAKP